MKFKVTNQFRHGPAIYEAGNTHDVENCAGMSEAHAEALHKAGLICIEGRQAEALATQPVFVAPNPISVGTS